MEDMKLKIGDIIQDKTEGTRYRVVAIVSGIATLCVMDIDTFQLMPFEVKSIMLLLSSEDLVRQEEKPKTVDIDALSDDVRADYENKLHLMHEVEQAYGPDFLGLFGRKPKPELNALCDKHHITKRIFWKFCRRYFQSGRNDTSLIDSRAMSPNKGRKYHHTKKAGKKPSILPERGVVLSQDVLNNFEDARLQYKNGLVGTWKEAYDYLIITHYYSDGSEDGTQAAGPYPISQTPTRDQFYYYMRTHMTHKDTRVAKTSEQDFNNSERLLLGDPTEYTAGCGDCVEIDACEFDVCLVSTTDKGQSVSHPTVYVALDQFSKAIVGCAVAYEQNSVMGITNLFLNIGDDKQEYCKKYGIGLNDPSWWPSNFLPARIRMDRGAEMASKAVGQICNILGIQRELVPPGSGSMKGYVESVFHQMQADMRTHLKHNGGVDHRYGSDPNEEAQLDIFDYTKLVIAFIIYYNDYYMENYRLTKDMMDEHIIPRPRELWKYGCSKFGDPKPISDSDQYQFALMTPIKPKYNRNGIRYKNLWYTPENDEKLLSKMLKAKNTMTPFDGVRMDMRCVDAMYYVRDGKLFKAVLKAGYRSFAGCTMQQWEVYRKQKQTMDILGRLENDRQDVDAFITEETIVESAKTDAPVSGDNIRPAREEERQAVNASMKMEPNLSVSPKQIESDKPTNDAPLDTESTAEKPESGNKRSYDVDDGADADWLAAVERALQGKLAEKTEDDADS